MNDTNIFNYVIPASPIRTFSGWCCSATSLSCRWTSWSGTRLPYAVIHRMAFDRRFVGRGLSAAALRLAEDLCREQGVAAIRIDTDPRNRRMQHILEKNGCRRCGTVLFQGSGKVAFDKAL